MPTYIPPRLALRVGVTGHRMDRLAGSLAPLRQKSTEILRFLKQVTGNLDAENKQLGANALFAIDLAPSLRLSTSIASGSDSLVADLAIAEGFELNLVLPFPRDIYQGDFEGQELEVFNGLIDHANATAKLELDVSRLPRDPKAYAAAGRLMLAHSDVLIAIWDGEPAAGVGGTAEIVADAQSRGLIVLWLSLDGRLQIWSSPESGGRPVADANWRPFSIDGPDGACSNELAAKVRALLLLPESGHPSPDHGTDPRSVSECIAHFRKDQTRTGSLAIGYNLLHWAFRGDPPFRFWVDNNVSSRDAQPHWDAVRDLAVSIEKSDSVDKSEFAKRIRHSLQDRWETADNLANYYATLFRSAYVRNFFLAALAVLVGLIVVLVPKEWEALAKFYLVLAEIVIILLILLTTYIGRRDRWQQRWLDYRSLAEALRPARLRILMGSSTLPPGSLVGLTPGQTWVAWYVRASLRAVPPPTARIGSGELKAVIHLAIQHEIDPQIGYHKSNVKKLRALDHNMEQWARYFLWASIASGIVYVVFYGGYLLLHDFPWSHNLYAAASISKPVVTFLGGTLPVFGAALFGIRATGDFRSSIRQSERTLAELHHLRDELTAQLEDPHRPALSRTLAKVVRTMSDDVRVWGMIYSERHLEAGF
jgi:hypothetical protein